MKGEVAESFGAIANEVIAKPGPLIKEKVVFVNRGPKMTPHIRKLVQARLMGLTRDAIQMMAVFDAGALEVLINEVTDDIETFYLGTNKLMLKHYEQAERLQNESRLIGSGDDADEC